MFSGIEVLYAPNEDDYCQYPTNHQLHIAVRTARQVAKGLKVGDKTLVTCWQGWNRSGLVSALALHYLTGRSGLECKLRVQKKRKGTLANPLFCSFLDSIPETIHIP
jgi:protein-tyrosine phosphatase